MLIILAIIVSFFLAMNVGANNSAAEMGPAYGAGVRTKRQALTLIAIFATLGAVLAGSKVIKTLSHGLVAEAIFKNSLGTIFVVMLVATAAIFFANVLRVPIATTHAIVCSIVGVGLFYQNLLLAKFVMIISWWVVTPLFALLLSYLMGKYFYFRILEFLSSLKNEDKIKKLLGILVTISGCYVAFSAGSNNAANSVGPIVGAGFLTLGLGAFLAGTGMSIGALIWGGRVIETVGKGITEIGIVRAILIEITSATIIIIASLFGIPVSLGEIVTASVIGLSCAKVGFKATARNEHVGKILSVWVLTPFLSIIATYMLLKFFSIIIPSAF